MAGEWETVIAAPQESGWEPVTGTPPSPAPAAQQQSGIDLGYFDPRGVPEAALSVGTGMAGQAIGGLSGLVGAALPGEQGQGARVAERVSGALTYRPRTKSGQSIVDIASLPGRAVEGVASKVGEKGEEVSPGLATVGKTAVHALPLLLGARQAMKPAAKLTPAQERVAAAQDAGFRMTPEEMGAGPGSKASAAISGEARLARLTSKKNQPLIVEKISRDLGLPKGTQLDLDTLAKVRKEAGMVHEEVRGMGQVTAGKEYFADLDKLGKRYANVSKDFPELAATDVQAVIEGARKPVFNASGAVDLISQLRQSASDAFSRGNSMVGKVQRGVAESIEAELGRHIQANAQAARLAGDVQMAATLDSLLKRYHGARTTIAKAHLAEEALIGDNAINPRVYARAAQEGAPLTGGAKDVGQFASSFERSSMKPTNQATGPTMWDLGPAAAGAVLSGWPGLAAFFARPAMRALLSSRGGQALMDPRTRISSGAAQAVGAGSVPRPAEKKTVTVTNDGSVDPEDSLAPVTANPLMERKVAAQMAANPRTDVTDFMGYGPDWSSYIANLSRNFASQFEGLGTKDNFMGPFGFGGITAFHGSPHLFNKFDMSKVGTGEGAQAYGHGLYFAENPKVANQYAKELGGSTYKVDIPDESVGKMLDWGKPLSEQSEGVKKALAPVYREYLQKNGTPQRMLDYHVNKATGEDIYHALRTGRGNAVASAMLKEMGIPGIKYLDQGSRTGGKGTSNFVVFDDQIPKILGRE